MLTAPLFGGGFGFADRRALHGDAGPPARRHRTRDAGYSRTFGFLAAAGFLLVSLNTDNPLDAGDSWAGELLQRLGDALRLGHLHGHWRQVRRHLVGHMNMMGNIAGFVAPPVGGIILDATRGTAFPNGDYNMFIYTMVGAYFLGAFCWPFIDPTKPLEVADSHTA
ncbi:MAG: hypothetical protein V9G12_16575 [Microthrixaceae bacterium]